MAKYYSLLLVPIVVGCIQTREGIKETEHKRVVQDQVSQMQKSNAENSSRYNELSQDIREMNGKIEVLENKVNQLSLHLKDSKGGDQALNLAQEKKIQALQDEMAKLEAQIVVLSQTVEALKGSPATDSSKNANTFDVAEDLFEKKEYKKAILAYQRFRDQNPKSKKNAKATYKIALSFQELGLKDDAKTFFEDLISKYPQSEEAKLAKAKLAGGEEKHAKPKKKKKEG